MLIVIKNMQITVSLLCYIRLSLSPYTSKRSFWILTISSNTVSQNHACCAHLLSLLASMVTGLGDDLWPAIGMRFGLSPV